jgi:hypothetical protein
MRNRTLDRPLIFAACLLAGFGLITLYSAGQTDIPTQAQGVWIRQLVWMAVGAVAAAVVFRFSFRILEWLPPPPPRHPAATHPGRKGGQGTAASSKNGFDRGHQVGQPAENQAGPSPYAGAICQSPGIPASCLPPA